MYVVTSSYCWVHEFNDDDKLLVNERWPIEELRAGVFVLGLMERSMLHEELFGQTGSSVRMVKVITPSGRIGWLLKSHLRTA